MTTFGLEFEVEGISPRTAERALNNGGIACDYVDSGIHDTSDYWKAVYDGSLNNGAEIVSPILGASRLNEAHRVAKILSDNGARTSTTAGFHVHFGATVIETSDAPDEALARLILNYYGVHHAIGALVAPSRLRNRFCRVLEKDEAIQEAEHALAGNRGSYRGDRYCSLNLESLQRHGTVEVRLHQSTLNGVKAIAWAQFIEALVKVSVRDIDLTTVDGLNAWTPLFNRRGARSFEACVNLLDTLVINNALAPATADWLKGRAKVLS